MRIREDPRKYLVPFTARKDCLKKTTKNEDGQSVSFAGLELDTNLMVIRLP